jgi:hypothetical protein
VPPLLFDGRLRQFMIVRPDKGELQTQQELGQRVVNEPTQLPISNLCKSKVSAEFYTVYESFHETVAWYTAHLKELKHAHGYSGGRSGTCQ